MRLEGQLAETLRQIIDQEENIKSLAKSIDDKDIPIKLSHTRLDTRARRPNVELCRDAVQVCLLRVFLSFLLACLPAGLLAFLSYLPALWLACARWLACASWLACARWLACERWLACLLAGWLACARAGLLARGLAC